MSTSDSSKPHRSGMKRRNFIKQAGYSAMGGALTFGLGGCSSGVLPPEKKTGYISPQIPEITFPAYDGERYQARVPDTLDLAGRAEYSIRLLTNRADPEEDYDIWWWVRFDRNPPVMIHKFDDFSGKFREALSPLRTITGSDLNFQVDQAWAESVLHMQGEDGLVYMPVVGKPWARPGWGQEYGDDGKSEHIGVMIIEGIWMGVMSLYYQLTKDELWKRRLQRLIDRVAQLMVYKDNFCYFPIQTLNPGAKVSEEMQILDPTCNEEAGGGCAGWIIQGLSQAYLATRYRPALILADKLAVYLTKYSGCYDEEARFLGMVHAHQHLRPISGLLEYALITDNREMTEFSRKAYEYAKSCGSPTVGFFPSVAGPEEFARTQAYCEGCTVTDMVALAIKLSQGNVADYWDDADRYIRNLFADIQVRSGDWFNRMFGSLPRTPVDEAKFETAGRVAQRNIGACIWASLANGPHPEKKELGGCCDANYARAVYYAWDNILNWEDGTLRVNLLLNRASPWADVNSYIPYEGRVDVKVKKPLKLAVRIPEWVKPQQTACQVNGKPRQLGWSGRYAQVGEVKSGDMAALSFPIAERTVKETMGGVDYTLIIKGNTVVSMDPAGEPSAYYQKAHYRENKARWRDRSRFIWSKPSLHWHY